VDPSGFRNPHRPKRARIVALGDSHTYGENVRSEDSWPRQLGRLTGEEAYNLGVGGYGMVQYYALMEEALSLEPEVIVIGFYPANDVHNILSYEKPLPEVEAIFRDLGIEEEILHRRRRNRERRDQGGLFERLGGKLRRETAIVSAYSYFKDKYASTRFGKEEAEDVFVRDAKNRTMISMERIRAHAAYVNMGSKKMRPLYRVAIEMIGIMKQMADERNVELVLLFVPSKELVFYEHLKGRGYELPKTYHLLARKEMRLRWKMTSFLDDMGIPHADALPGMRALVETDGSAYPRTDDGHPLAPGYGAYATAVYEVLQRTAARRQ
jgi:lysophospholipase L1-like esterase